MPNRNRKTSLDRIREAGFEAVADGVDPASRPRDGNYGISLTNDAAENIQDFASVAVLAGQLDSWERAVFDGQEKPAQPLAPVTWQEILFELVNLRPMNNIVGFAVYFHYDQPSGDSGDPDARPTGGTVYTVAEYKLLNASQPQYYPSPLYRSDPNQLQGFDPTWRDDDCIGYIILDIPQPQAGGGGGLVDTDYGADIVDGLIANGSLRVQNGQVVHVATIPDVVLNQSGSPLPFVDSIVGHHIRRSYDLPASTCDCQNPPLPPPPPPPPPPPGGKPSPYPNQPVTIDKECSTIFQDTGFGVNIPFEDQTFAARAYGNIPLFNSNQYPLELSGLIHNWLVTNVAEYVPVADYVFAVRLRLSVSLSDEAFAINLFPRNTQPPNLGWHNPSSENIETIKFFEIDQTRTDTILGVNVTRSLYEQSHNQNIRDKDRRYTKENFYGWVFFIDKGDFQQDALTPLQLQMCGVTLKKHQMMCSFALDGTDDAIAYPVELGDGVALVDKYKNAYLPIGTYSFFGTPYWLIQTDSVHPVNIEPDWDGNAPFPHQVTQPYTSMNGSVTIKPVAEGAPQPNDTHFHLVVSNITTGQSYTSNSIELKHDDSEKTMSFAGECTIATGDKIHFALSSDQEPLAAYQIKNLTMYLA